MTWQFDPRIPVSVQIVEKLRLEILNGNYPPESQFPTVRQLALEASVNPNTMQKALSVLENEGLLVSRGTVGRFVSGDTDALDSAREEMRREHMEKMLEHARELGITGEMIVQFIQEREASK